MWERGTVRAIMHKSGASRANGVALPPSVAGQGNAWE
jgi:hypothetical protein